MPSSSHTVTALLREAHAGDGGALDVVLPLVYDELRRLARRERRRRPGHHTLDTAALVHEAYLRLVDAPDQAWENRVHFLAVAAKAMRHTLIDHARRRQALKRGGDAEHVPIDPAAPPETPAVGAVDDLLALDDALRRLEAIDPRQARVVECRFFAAMTVDETAAALGVSPSTVTRSWRMAQAWLYRTIRPAADGG